MARAKVVHHSLTHDEALALVPFGTVTDEELADAMSPRGGWTAETLAAWGVPWPAPGGWKARLTGKGKPPEAPVSAPMPPETLDDRIRRIVREEIARLEQRVSRLDRPYRAVRLPETEHLRPAGQEPVHPQKKGR